MLQENFQESRKKLKAESQESHNITDSDEALSVFCVSPTIFHELGKVNKDRLPYEGFNSKAETGIPELSAICKESTYAARDEDLQAYLTKIEMFASKLSWWASSEAAERISFEQKDQVKQTAEEQFQNFKAVSF